MSSPADTSTESAPVIDERREELLGLLRADLGDAVVDTVVRPGDDVWARVATEAWSDAGRVARDKLGCAYFCFLSALDWMPSPYGRGEDDPTEPPPERSTEIVQGVAGGATRFQVFARVYSVAGKLGITLKADVPDDTLRIGTWVRAYSGADWHERETWEMFGIEFVGHPGLRKLYLPSAFEGYPLRKDFPLLARHIKPWPGIVDVEPMPAGLAGDGESESEGEASE